jgi:hypothetical protein
MIETPEGKYAGICVPPNADELRVQQPGMPAHRREAKLVSSSAETVSPVKATAFGGRCRWQRELRGPSPSRLPDEFDQIAREHALDCTGRGTCAA